MPASTAHRLAGFRFEAPAPPLRDFLPRMDVAAFVGFAASGPVGVPVQIEDEHGFEELFGRDLPLAWDRERGEVVSAYLAPAVRAFFRNGGRRCWVVRLARAARSNRFAVPGLARLSSAERLPQATALARSEGSWSDDVAVGTALSRRPFRHVETTASDGILWFHLDVEARADIVAGDLLRFVFSTGDVLLLFVRVLEDADPSAGSLAPSSPSGGPRRARVRLAPESLHWFRVPSALPIVGGTARFRGLDGSHQHAAVAVPIEPWPGDGRVTLELEMPFADSPPPGSLVHVDFGGELLCLTVDDARLRERPAPSSGPVVVVGGQGLWQTTAPPGWESLVAVGERLTFELHARSANGSAARLADLGFHPSHPRFWGALPTDAALFDERSSSTAAAQAALIAAATHPRFPLAGDLSPGDLFLPVGMSLLPGTFLPAIRSRDAAYLRDGLAVFSSGLFLDADLAHVYTPALANEADFLRYTSPTPRRLRGIHAALGLEEATLIAVPDAGHRGWMPLAETTPPPPERSPPIDRPEDWPCCDQHASALVGRAKLEPGDFRRCDLEAIAPPVLSLVATSDPGTYSIAWTAADEARFVLEEAARSDFGDALVVYDGPGDHADLFGRRPGDYYYRVRVEIGVNRSEWSEGIVHRVPAPVDALLLPVADYDDTTLVDVHRAVLRLAAARGDLLAVLALPEHYREADAASHAAALGFRIRPNQRPPHGIVPPLGTGEERTLSYGALYHPWIVGGDAADIVSLTRLPPDGAMAGVMAGLALRRGAWLAPANARLRGVVDLTDGADEAGLRVLQDAHVNWLRQEPYGFVVLSADTLMDDEDLGAINVRRLLQLLRRLALREGQTYVFEPNDPAFRRSVQRGFESLLGLMFERGAFSGRTPSTSFRVVTGDEVNTPQSVDLGRCFVELRVAPSRPLSFLTVRLVQLGDRRLVAEEA